jgi:putative addiction module component (TIGR02574 family)
MAADAKRIESEALTLPDEERVELAHKLLESVEAVDPHAHLSDDQLAAEIERRAKTAGKRSGSPWDEVRARIETQLKK